jgi:hypothetical protein
VLIEGPPRILGLLAAEYRPALDGASAPALAVRFTDAAGESSDENAVVVRGGHKTVSWTVRVHPGRSPLGATIALRGYPRPFGLSLVQGYFLEPLLSLVAAEDGAVLLPSSGIVLEDGVTILLGRSGSGKSTLSARALAAGRPILGDDQIIVDRSAGAWAFPRRMRFYADLPRTSPEAYAALSPRDRAALVARRVGVAATRGFVAPPIRVPVSALGPPLPRGPHAIARVVLLERGGGSDGLEVSRPSAEEMVDLALAILDEQRAKLAAGAGAAWLDRLAAARAAEGELLTRAFEASPLERYRIPSAWSARKAAGELARRLRIAD